MIFLFKKEEEKKYIYLDFFLDVAMMWDGTLWSEAQKLSVTFFQGIDATMASQDLIIWSKG